MDHDHHEEDDEMTTTLRQKLKEIVDTIRPLVEESVQSSEKLTKSARDLRYEAKAVRKTGSLKTLALVKVGG